MIRTSLLAAAALASIGAIAATPTAALALGKKTEKSAAPNIVETKSAHDFETTLAKLTAAIDARGFKTFAVVDHAKGAASVDAELRPTTLVIFGNPKGGTPLIQAAQTMGFDLPLKALVFENAEGEVIVAVSDIASILKDHGVTGKQKQSETIAGALGAIAGEAAQ